MKRPLIITILILVLIGVVVGGYQYHAQKVAVEPLTTVVPVVVARVKSQKVSNQIHAVGTLQPIRQVNLAPQIDGQIVAVLYQPGRRVKAGKTLIQLDDRIYRARLRSAESVLRLAKMDFQRVSKLAKTGAASQQLLDQKRAAFQQAQASVSTNQTFLAETSIKAPFDGYVGAKVVSIGDYVKKGQHLTTLTDRSLLTVNYQLPERYLSALKLGQHVSIEVPHQHHFHVVGKVSFISPTVDELTHSVLIQAAIPNNDNQLAPGLFVRVHQVTHINDHALIIPQAAIVPTIMGPEVYVIKHNKAFVQRIKTGNSFESHIEVLDGLNAGDQVVIAGQQRLQDGVKVREVTS